MSALRLRCIMVMKENMSHLEAVAWTSLVPARIADWVRNKYHYMTEKWAELELSVWCVRKKGFMGFCSKNVLKSAWFYTSRQTLVIFLSYFFFRNFQTVPDPCATRSGLMHKCFQNDRQKNKETSHLVHNSSVVREKILDRCEGSLQRGLVIKKYNLQFKAHVPNHCKAKLIKLFYSFQLRTLTPRRIQGKNNTLQEIRVSLFKLFLTKTIPFNHSKPKI